MKAFAITHLPRNTTEELLTLVISENFEEAVSCMHEKFPKHDLVAVDNLSHYDSVITK